MANYVSSRITIDSAKINRITAAASKALGMTADAMLSQMVNKQVIPFEQGTLQNSGSVDYIKQNQGSVEIRFITPYARRLYFHPEYHFHREAWKRRDGRLVGGNKNAGGKWMEPWISGKYKDFCRKAYMRFLKKEGGL